MLCDRVGVIVGGKLQGVGAPEEIVGMKAHGMEILFERAVVVLRRIPPLS